MRSFLYVQQKRKGKGDYKQRTRGMRREREAPNLSPLFIVILFNVHKNPRKLALLSLHFKMWLFREAWRLIQDLSVNCWI